MSREKGFFPSEGVLGWSVLTKLMSISLVISVVMYSSEQYCPNGFVEVPRSKEDFVLDLRVRTQESPKHFQLKTEESFHEEQIFTNGFHNSEIKINQIRGASNCTPSPTILSITPNVTIDNGFHSPEIKINPINEANNCSPSPTILRLTPNTTTKNGKPTRPFKAYPKNFLELATAEGIVDESGMRFLEFRKQCLSQIHPTTGTVNKNMKRPVHSIRPVESVSPTQLPSSSIRDQTDLRDQAYWERRRKNNEAAKKSRDARRAKEDEIAIRAAFLERENLQLRLELASLRGEVERLRYVLYGKN